MLMAIAFVRSFIANDPDVGGVTFSHIEVFVLAPAAQGITYIALTAATLLHVGHLDLTLSY